MNEDLAQIEVYFPDGEFSNLEEVVAAIADEVEANDSLDYCGFRGKDDLKEGLLDKIGKGSLDGYRPISPEEKSEIKKTISETITACNEELSIPTKNFIFVHPFFPDEDAKVFDGVMGVTVYSCVFHLFVDLQDYKKQSLVDTVAHELNHTIFYYHHFENLNNFSLLENIVMEGLAENFKEEYFTPETTPWAGALEKEEAFAILEDFQESFDVRDYERIQKFLYGGEEKKRWTGYSAGYWLTKGFIAENSDLSWNEIMKLDANEFLEVI